MTGSGTEMPTRYDAAAVEPRWAETWIERGYFHAQVPKDPSDAYCIVIPPRTSQDVSTSVTHSADARGRLDPTRADAGLQALWVPGMDHAGIATQVVVERELRKEGIERRDLGREAFVERVWAWKERYGGEIIGQLKRMGASLDWDRERFTMDEGLVRAVRVAFVRWYEQGLIYRGERLVNWCPTDQTGLSDSEIEHEEVDGELSRSDTRSPTAPATSRSRRRGSRRCSATRGSRCTPTTSVIETSSGRRCGTPSTDVISRSSPMERSIRPSAPEP